jgi:signal transduction histidine kinase
VTTTCSPPGGRTAVTFGDRRGRLWWALAVFGSLGCAAFAVLPSSLVVLREVVLYPMLELSAAVAIVAGVWRYRPRTPAAWLFIGAGIGFDWVGDIIFGVYDATGRQPFPSVADGFYLTGYPLIVTGLLIGIMRRRGRDPTVAIDVTLVSVIAGLALWVYVMVPTLAQPGQPVAATLVTLAYPVSDLLVFIVAVRLVMGGSWGARSLRYLVAGLALTLAGDVLFATGVFTSGGATGRLYETCLLVGVVCIALSGIDPSMRALTERVPAATDRSAVLRLILLGAASLTPITIWAIQEVRGAPLHLAATITAMISVSVLVVVRLWLVNRRAQRSANDEATLARCAADLLGADGVGELYDVAARAARELAGGSVELVISGNGTDPAPASREPPLTIPVEVRGRRVAVLRGHADPRRAEGKRETLSTVARQLALALERDDLLRAEQATAETLARQNEQLRELDRMKDRFVGTVSHELRTPLTSILGCTEMLLDDDAGALAAAQRHLIEIVDRNCRRLDRLVDDILTTARIESGRFSHEPRQIDFAEVVTQEVEAIKAAAQQAGVALELRAPDGELILNGDPMRLAQLCDNLLTNAVKFTPAGGSVTVILQVRDRTAHLEVRDTGPGIPQEELPLLFGRFYRASTAGQTRGTGLGLSIAKTIAEAHDGGISVRSAVGAGTTFSVTLPLGARPSTQAK